MANPEYRRSLIVRFCNRHYSAIRWLITLFLPCMVAALLFGMMPVAILLHIGNAETPGPVGCNPEYRPPSSLSCHVGQKQTWPPDPGLIASGENLEIPGDEL